MGRSECADGNGRNDSIGKINETENRDDDLVSEKVRLESEGGEPDEICRNAGCGKVKKDCDVLARVSGNIRKHELFLSFSAIAVLVLAFNYEAVTGLDVLLLDDQSRFCNAIKGQFFIPYFYEFGWVPYLWKAMNLKLMVQGMEIARGFYLAVFAVPLSAAVYYFNRKSLGLAFTPSFISAVLINILPFQHHIPKFIDGSYPLPAMLFLFLSLVFSVNYLNAKGKIDFVLTMAFWYLASQSCGELAIVILPSLLFLFVLRDSSWKAKTVLMSTYVVILLPRIYQVVYKPRGGAGKAVLLDPETVVFRIKKVVAWGSLVNMDGDGAVIFALIAVILAIVIGFLLFLKDAKAGKWKEAFSVYGFYLLFAISTMSPFVFASKYFSARYFFVFYLASWVLITLSLYQILKRLFRRERLCLGILLVMLLFAGFQRHGNQCRQNALYNSRNDAILRALDSMAPILPDGQVVIVGIFNGTGQYFVWSTGYIQYCLKRSDVAGLIGNEYHFYDAFDVTHQGYGYQMEGFDINKPVYAIRYAKGKFVQPEFFLRWLDRKNRNSGWILYRRDPSSAMLSEVFKGKGLPAYKKKITEMGLGFDEILWGDVNAESWRKGI